MLRNSPSRLESMRLGALPFGVLAALLCSACDRSQEPVPPFNQPLGNTSAGAPLAMPPADTAILKDLAGYQPTALPSASGRAGGGAVAAGDSEGQVRATVVGALISLVKGDLEAALDSVNTEQIKALRDDADAMGTLHTLYEKGITLANSVGSKLGQPPLDFSSIDNDAVVKQLGVMGLDLAQLMKVEMVDDNTAAVTFNGDKLREKIPMQLPPGITPGGLAPPGGADAAAAQPAMGNSPPLPLLRQDGKWMIQLPTAITAEQVKAMSSQLKMAQTFLDKLTEKIDKAEFKTIEEFQAAAGPIIMETIAESMAAQLDAGAGDDSGAKDGADKGDEKKEPGDKEDGEKPETPDAPEKP